MPVLDRFKLHKLTINGYKDKARDASHLVSTFVAMYNPASVKQRYCVKHSTAKPIGRGIVTQRFVGVESPALDLTLILDGTVVDSIGSQPITVAERVQNFLKTAYAVDGRMHEPHYLTVEWGQLNFWGEPRFNCVLNHVDITYTSFNRDGSALRAELAISLIEDEDPKHAASQLNLQSPDLTHHRIVKSGDTLPMLCREVYGDSRHYLHIAEVNQLDNFRRLQPGQQLYFPPLATT